MTQGNRVPDAAADEQTRAAATEDYGGVPISEGELAEVWLADAADSAEADADPAADAAAGGDDAGPGDGAGDRESAG